VWREGLGKLKKKKKINDLIRILTRDLPACSIVPQPTTLVHARPNIEAGTILFHFHVNS
jgi:hypothetical protein